MPRVYKRTTSKAKTSSKDMKDALHLIQKGKSIRETVITSKIPYPTLRRYWKDFLLDENTRLTPNYYVKRIFTDKQELELKEYILTCSRMFMAFQLKNVGV